MVVIHSVENPEGAHSRLVCSGSTPCPSAHGHQFSDQVIIWKSEAGLRPTAARLGCNSTPGPTRRTTTEKAMVQTSRNLAAPLAARRRRSARQPAHRAAR
jgi:hypothetical protein